jgi:hypothetical protein
MSNSVHYYNVTLDNETTIVKANNTTQVRQHIMSILQSRYDYGRASTDEVIKFLESGEELEDLTATDEPNAQDEAEAA